VNVLGYRKYALSIVLLVLLTATTFSIASNYSNSVKELKKSGNNNFELLNAVDEEDMKNVYILYDEGSEAIKLAASRIYFMVRMAYPLTSKYGIYSVEMLESYLFDRPDIAILILNTTSSYVQIGSNKYSWKEFGNLLSKFSEIEYVLAIGNTYMLNPYRTDKWHYDEYEFTGITSIEVYAIWETARIFKTFGEKYNATGSRMEQIAVRFYAENLGRIFEENVDPEIVIGDRDPEIRALAIQRYLERHPNTMNVTKVSPDGVDRPLLIGWKGVTPEADDDIDFMEIPFLSGLKGPIGDFVDKVLNFLLSEGSSMLSIDLSFVQELVNIFVSVKDFIGDPSLEGAGSLLRSFLDLLKNEFPYLENYTKYFDLFVKGFYALKGDLQSIINFIAEAVGELFPDLGGTMDQLKSILISILNIGPEVMDLVGKISDNQLDVLLDWIVTKLANLSIEKLLESIPGLTDIAKIYGNITSIVKLAIDLISVKNATDFVDKLSDLLINKLKIVTDPEIVDLMNKVKNIINLVITFINKEEKSLRGLLEDAILAFIPSSYISDIQDLINDIMDEVDSAIKEAKSDLNAFITRIETILDTYITSTDETITKAKEVIKKTIVLITTISNTNFDIESVDNIISILNDILNQFLDEPIDIKEKIMMFINATLLPFGGLGAASRVQKAFFNTVDFLKDYKTEILNLLIEIAKTIIKDNFPSINIDQIEEYITNGIKIVNAMISAIGDVRDRPFDGIFTILMFGAAYVPAELFDELSIGNITKILEVLLPDLMGLDHTPSLEDAIDIVMDALGSLISNSTIKDTIENVLIFLFEIREVLRNGIKWLTNKVLDWVAGKVGEFVGQITSKIEDLINNFAFLNLDGQMNLGIGGLDFLTFSYYIAIKANFNIDEVGLVREIKDMIMNGKIIDLINPINAFWTLIKKIEIIPTFEAGFELKSMFSDDNELMQKVIESLGVSIDIEGEARFKLELFAFQSGTFDGSRFMNLVEWYLRFKLEVSKTFTIFDLIGAPTLGAIAEEIGLDGITVTLSLGVQIEILIGSSSEDGGDQSTLTVELYIAGKLHIGFDIVIAEVSLDFTLTITFRFTFDITKTSNPIVFTIEVSYKLKIHLEFLFVGDTYTFGGVIYSYTFPQPGETPEDKASGFDKDGDGLPDQFEESNFGFSPDRADTDNDGIDDNMELNGYGTDPLDPDTDGDGLTDYEEIYETGTNPFEKDSDSDKLIDYLEAKVYGTNPNEVDTDGDGLDDYFEVTHVWDISAVTISIAGVQIGGQIYYDHTDPLNPDTDGDGLLDGQEGPMGGYYGEMLYDFGPNPIIFNYGYTHPLDNDTDDDSYLQLSSGKIYEPKVFLMSMTDKDEIDGITVIFIEDGEPVLKTFRTSPVCPDTDQDTGTGAVIINSDSYELSLDPPTDPLDGDTDDDGLIDGNEGVSSPYSNKTDPHNPDTDGDGLGDMQEVLMGLDPGNPDSDYDMVIDGDEVLKYGTNPRMEDSDLDGLTDGEELFFWHSNPMLRDSDDDGLTDGEEVLIYFTNPMDEDTDNDYLFDLEEVIIHHTNPREIDSDYDGIIDGEEVKIYFTDPLNWDTDGDSIPYPNEYGAITWPMGDGDEVYIFGTSPLLSDTDGDGLLDSIETYLASGVIPDFEPIPLNALVNDTDGDGLLDGTEMRVELVFDIVYPYISYNITYPHGTSPVVYDSDSDGINDYLEVTNYSTMPYSNDTDGDNLSDYDEIYIYNTSPVYWDTDYDNISDYDELFGYGEVAMLKIPKNPRIEAIYITDPTDPDTDDDLLPDGYELMVTGTSPVDSDTDDDGLIDGYEFDTDGDGLTDGEEFFIFNTSYYPQGGPGNPDSDGDGISDGEEVHVYGTDPANPDSDGDGIPDGAEVAVGTDPNELTGWDEYEDMLNERLGEQTIAILTPLGEISDRFVDVRIANSTPLVEVWFRYIKDDVYSDNYTMTYDNVSKQWVYSDIVWSEGAYTIEVFGRRPDGTVIKTVASFSYKAGPQPNYYLWLGIGIAAGFAIALIVIFVLPRVFKRGGKKNQNIGGLNNE